MPLSPSVTKDRIKIASACSWVTYKSPGQGNLKISGSDEQDDRESDEIVHRDALVVDDPDFQRRRNDLESCLDETGRKLRAMQPFYKGLESDRRIAGYVIVTDKEIVVAYRGTVKDGAHADPREEERADLNYAFSDMTFGNEEPIGVHTGFKAQYQASLIDLKEVLKAQEKEMPGIQALPVLTTGHSLGGALAKMNALDYTCQEENMGREVICIPLASPSPFKEPDLFNSKLHDSTLCINNQRDRVLNVASIVYKPKPIGYDVTIPAGKFFSGGHMEDPYTQIVDKLTNEESPDLDKNPLIKNSMQPTLLSRTWTGIKSLFSFDSKATSSSKTLTYQEQKAMQVSQRPIDASLNAALHYQTTSELATRMQSVDRELSSDRLFNNIGNQPPSSEKFLNELGEAEKNRLKAFEKEANKRENFSDDEDDNKGERQSI